MNLIITALLFNFIKGQYEFFLSMIPRLILIREMHHKIRYSPEVGPRNDKAVTRWGASGPRVLNEGEKGTSQPWGFPEIKRLCGGGGGGCILPVYFLDLYTEVLQQNGCIIFLAAPLKYFWPAFSSSAGLLFKSANRLSLC